MRLGQSASEGSDNLVLVKAVRERLTKDRSEADTSPLIRAAILAMVDKKIKARQSKAISEEEKRGLEGDEAKAISAPNCNNLKRLSDCKAYDSAWRGM